jgi:hypothetical protein
VAVQRFQAELERRGQGVVVELPFDVRAAFGQARPPVCGTIQGVPFRSTVAVYGGRSYLGFRRELRDAARVSPGDSITIEVDRDDEPREVTVPADLAAALAEDADARAAWDALSFTHRREYVEAIEEAKREGTRRRRVEGALEALRRQRS